MNRHRSRRFSQILSASALVVSLTLAGCGAQGATGPGDDTGAAPTSSPSIEFSANAVDDLEALASERAAAASDPAVSEAIADIGAPAAGVAEELLPGGIEEDRGRLLQTDLGERGSSLWVFPTAKGHACYILTNAGAGCVEAFDVEDGGVAWSIFDRDVLREGEPVGVFGLAADGVLEVSVVIDGETYSAELENNGFFYQHSDSSVPPESVKQILIQYADGSLRAVSTGFPSS